MPKENINVPQIRFPGFTDDWEQCKFLDGVSEIGDGLYGTPILAVNRLRSLINKHLFHDPLDTTNPRP